MNNQFATQHLREPQDEFEPIRNIMRQLGAEEDSVNVLIKAIELEALTPSEAIEILKKGLGIHETSSVGGGDAGGPTAATVTPGDGEQYFAGTRKKQYQEDAPRLAGSPAKTNKQGSKNLSGYSSVGFTKAPSAAEAGKKLKSIDVEELWESKRYSQFKKEAALRSKPQQMHEAAKIISNKLEEINKLLEFTRQMRSELSEGDEVIEYSSNTKKVFEKIHHRVVEVYSKIKKLKGEEKPKLKEVEQRSGLIVVGRTPEDNTKIAEMVEDMELHAEWNAREGYWFFEEQEELYDELERWIQSGLDQYDINARIEGVFGGEHLSDYMTRRMKDRY